MWNFLWYFLAVLYVPACIGLIVIVLLQKGKGTGFAGAFGVGPGSETVFGPQTAQGTPVKITYIMAAMFMTIALLMSLISGRVGSGMAPELLDESAMSDTTSTTTGTGLEEFGLGTGVVGQVDSNAITVDAPAADGAPVAVEPAPATDAAPAETAPEVTEPAPAAAAPEAAETAPTETLQVESAAEVTETAPAPAEAAEPADPAPAAPAEEAAPAAQ